MNQSFVFVIILLTTLFTVNTRATIFYQCPETPTLLPLNVTIAPDPLAAGSFGSFSISGTLNNAITSNTQLVIMFSDTNQDPLVPLYIQNFQDTSGQQINVNVQVPTPINFPADYCIAIVVGNPNNSPNQSFDTYGCAYATYGQMTETNSIMSVVEDSYPVADQNMYY
ncbi:hypothetical protein C1646_672077 [Rhizophagus diaphanus]|nr:hypothetical protein C1646_672077 [Rhizophagus diaphanus] [Rhizophagus sp. MUCL 43196]